MHVEWLIRFISAVFAVGTIGCLLSLPFIVRQFFRVLFEKDTAEE